MSHGWIDASFELAGHRIDVAVKRLPRDEAVRLGASLAFFAQLAATPGVDLDTSGWPGVLQRIMGDYVALTLGDEALGHLEELWTPLCSGVLRTFAQVNEIDSSVTQQLVAGPDPVC